MAPKSSLEASRRHLSRSICRCSSWHSWEVRDWRGKKEGELEDCRAAVTTPGPPGLGGAGARGRGAHGRASSWQHRHGGARERAPRLPAGGALILTACAALSYARRARKNPWAELCSSSGNRFLFLCCGFAASSLGHRRLWHPCLPAPEKGRYLGGRVSNIRGKSCISVSLSGRVSMLVHFSKTCP